MFSLMFVCMFGRKITQKVIRRFLLNFRTIYSIDQSWLGCILAVIRTEHDAILQAVAKHIRSIEQRWHKNRKGKNKNATLHFLKQVVKVIWQKDPIAAAHERFIGIRRQFATNLIHASMGPPESRPTTQTASRSVQPFLHSSRQSVHFILYNRPPFPLLKIAHSHRITWTPSNIWFLRPIRVLNQNGISIGSTVFVGLTSVTDPQTGLKCTIISYKMDTVHVLPIAAIERTSRYT